MYECDDLELLIQFTIDTVHCMHAFAFNLLIYLLCIQMNIYAYIYAHVCTLCTYIYTCICTYVDVYA